VIGEDIDVGVSATIGDVAAGCPRTDFGSGSVSQ